MYILLTDENQKRPKHTDFFISIVSATKNASQVTTVKHWKIFSAQFDSVHIQHYQPS